MGILKQTGLWSNKNDKKRRFGTSAGISLVILSLVIHKLIMQFSCVPLNKDKFRHLKYEIIGVYFLWCDYFYINA